MTNEAAGKTKKAPARRLELRRLTRRVLQLQGLLLLLSLIWFPFIRTDVASVTAYAATLVVFAAVILMLGFTGLLSARPRILLRVECVLMVLFMTAIFGLSSTSQGPLLMLYLLPVILGALILSRSETAAILTLVLFCRVGLSVIDGQQIPDSGYLVSLLTEALPVLLLAFLTSALAREFTTVEKRLRILAEQDNLTGLLNLTAFSRLLHLEHARTRRSDEKYTILMIDIDGLKTLNDKHGHEQGNRAIVAVADALKRSARADDLIARYGGDEFTICLAGADRKIAQAVGSRIRHNVYRTTLDLATEITRLTVSVGAATFPDDGDSPEALLQSADRAMYQDKQLRRAPGEPDSPEGRTQSLGEEY